MARSKIFVRAVDDDKFVMRAVEVSGDNREVSDGSVNDHADEKDRGFLPGDTVIVTALRSSRVSYAGVAVRLTSTRKSAYIQFNSGA